MVCVIYIVYISGTCVGTILARLVTPRPFSNYTYFSRNLQYTLRCVIMKAPSTFKALKAFAKPGVYYIKKTSGGVS